MTTQKFYALDTATKYSLWLLGIVVGLYMIYILEGITYLATDDFLLERDERDITLGGNIMWYFFLNLMLLMVARTVQHADLSFAAWVWSPLLAHCVLLALIVAALELNTNIVFILLLLIFCMLPQIYFICLWRRILNNRRPLRIHQNVIANNWFNLHSHVLRQARFTLYLRSRYRVAVGFHRHNPFTHKEPPCPTQPAPTLP